MNKFELTHQWIVAGGDDPEIQQTMCMFGLSVGEVSLTQNEDIFSKTISDNVLISAYPFAHWLAHSWWRLLHEPLPSKGVSPSVDWRMAHEIGASNHGFVWPQIMWASDKAAMQIWAAPARHVPNQSIRYINGLNYPVYIPLDQFEINASRFIESVIARLRATGIQDTELASLWTEVLSERADPAMARFRRLEAELGYDPDECPESEIQLAISLEEMMGEQTLAELAPVYGKVGKSKSIEELATYVKTSGMVGKPNIPALKSKSRILGQAPWQKAVDDAHMLREKIGYEKDKLENSTLLELLGVDKSFVDAESSGTHSASLAVPYTDSSVTFISRKRHPIAKRFEMARFVGDIIFTGTSKNNWLAQTDLSTYRQKYQRAFAAELLCPIKNLEQFLNDDFSEGNIEDAAYHFGISPDSVNSLLANNGLLFQREFESAKLPYRVAY